MIGSVFEHALLGEVAGDSDLEHNLDALVEREITFESKSFPEVEYSFKSVLVQQCAYSGLLLKEQREMHLKVGEAIETLYRGRLEEHFESLSRHYHSAQKLSKAYDYSVRAGLKAKDKHAPAEAIASLQRAIDIFPQIDAVRIPIEQAYHALAEVFEVNGDLKMAIEYLEKFAESVEEVVGKGDTVRRIGKIWDLYLVLAVHIQHPYAKINLL